MSDVLDRTVPTEGVPVPKAQPKPASLGLDAVGKQRVTSALGMGDMDRTLREDKARIAALDERASFPKLTPPPPQQAQTDPLQAFGQPAMWLAAFGSLMTRRPLVNAINAAGTVLQATHQMDQAAAKSAYDTWKIESENAIKLAKFEQDSLKNAIARYGTDARSGEAMLRTHILAYKAASLDTIYQEGGMPAVIAHEKHGRGSLAGAETGVAQINKQVETTMGIVTGWRSDDPTLQAKAIEDKVASDRPFAKTPVQKLAQHQNEQMAVALAADLKSGDPEKQAAAQKRGEQIISMAAGVLKAPKPEHDKNLKWEIFTDPTNGTQYRSAMGKDGKPINLTLTGEPYTPGGASRIGTALDAGVAKARDAKQEALQLHQDRLATIAEDKLISSEERDRRKQDETERYHRVIEQAKIDNPSPASAKEKDAEILATEKFKEAHDGRAPGPGDAAEMAHLRGIARAEKPGFTPQMSELMAELAMRGVTIPAGYRSRDQQIAAYSGAIATNPGKSMAEIADLIKIGQIEFGAQKKETTTAAGVAGRVAIAVNELETMGDLALAASAAVPRGSFMPISKLMQITDKNLSDPALRDLKIKTTSIMNAYDVMAARGGTDKEKRLDARNLLLSADSPAVYARAIKAFREEGAAAQLAAEKAMHVRPSTPPATASGKADGSAVQKPTGMTDDALRSAAKSSIASGKNKAAIIEQLRAWGVDTSGL